jgi:RHS repeat-associated protein
LYQEENVSYLCGRPVDRVFSPGIDASRLLPEWADIMSIGASARTTCRRGTMGSGISGKERDAETGLDYFGARYFFSPQGRFTSPDPTFLNILMVTNPQRWNLYGYGLNNPLRYVDPDGEESRLIIRAFKSA